MFVGMQGDKHYGSCSFHHGVMCQKVVPTTTEVSGEIYIWLWSEVKGVMYDSALQCS
jgi:hypothetical protein